MYLTLSMTRAAEVTWLAAFLFLQSTPPLIQLSAILWLLSLSYSGNPEKVGSGHVMAQAVYIVPIEKCLTLFQGDERKEDCTLLGKVKLNAFRPSSSSNPWVMDESTSLTAQRTTELQQL